MLNDLLRPLPKGGFNSKTCCELNYGKYPILRGATMTKTYFNSIKEYEEYIKKEKNTNKKETKNLCNSCINNENNCSMNPQGKTKSCIKFKVKEVQL